MARCGRATRRAMVWTWTSGRRRGTRSRRTRLVGRGGRSGERTAASSCRSGSKHMHDLVIRAGRVIDEAQGIDGVVDVAIDGQRISAVGTDLAADGARQVVDASGLIVTPGLI